MKRFCPVENFLWNPARRAAVVCYVYTRSPILCMGCLADLVRLLGSESSLNPISVGPHQCSRCIVKGARTWAIK